MEQHKGPDCAAITAVTPPFSPLLSFFSPPLPLAFVLVDGRRRSNLYTGSCREETCHQHLFTIISLSLREERQGSSITLEL